MLLLAQITAWLTNAEAVGNALINTLTQAVLMDEQP